MKKLLLITLAVLLVAATLCLLLSFTVFGSDGYTEIDTVAELKAISSSGNYRLTADITLSDGSTLPAFSGNFDGNGHTVKGLTAPLFTSLSGCVSDLTLEGTVTASGSAAVGALAKTASGDLTVKNVTVNCTVKAASATGVAGFIGSVAFSKAGTVSFENCVNKGAVSGAANVAGFVGQVSNSSTAYTTVEATLCINEGAISMTSQSANIGVGGIVGYGGRYSEVIADKCSNRGNISSAGGDNGLGGIYGGGSWTSGDAQKFTARYCSNYGNVTVGSGRGRAGGICGRMNRYGSTYLLEYCYNVGTITTGEDSASGIFSYTNSSASLTVRYCYSAGTLKTVGGGELHPIAASGAAAQAVAKDNYYINSTTNNAGENIDATLASSRDVLNSILLAFESSPFIVDPKANNGYAILAWECDHVDSVLDSCVGKICEVCGTVLEEKNGTHSFGAWVTDKQATETEDGLRHKACTKCSVVEYEIIPSTTTVTPIEGVYSVKSSAELIWVFNGIMDGTIPASTTIRLTADIDVKGLLPMLTTAFTGVFDGNGKTLSGLSKTIFKQFNGTVTDLIIAGDIDTSSLTDHDSIRKAASFALNSESAVYNNLVSYVNITTSRNDLNAGGLVGYTRADVSFVNCAYFGDYLVEWTGDGAGIGGLVGWSNSSGGTTTFEGCHFGGSIRVMTGATGKEAYIGGILGNATNATVKFSRCVSDGEILSEISSGDDYVGGILGVNKNGSTTIDYSSNLSELNAVIYAGGLVGGTTENITLTYCSNYMLPLADTAGAFCGYVSDGKSLKCVSSADISASGLKFCGEGSSTSSGSYTSDKVNKNGKSFTLEGVDYVRYNVVVAEKKSGILVPLLSTNKKFTAYVSIRDDGRTHAVRFVILTNLDYDTESVTVSIDFKDDAGNKVKSLVKKLAVTNSDFTMYSAVSAGDVNYFALEGNALFGLVVTDIPMGAWDSVDLSIVDTADGTEYLAPVSYSVDSINLMIEALPDLTSLGTVSPTLNVGPGLLSDRTATTAEDSYMTVVSNTTAAKLASYVETLPAYGYEFISKNTIDGDTYYTYRKFGSLLYLYHNASIGETRIIADNSSDLLSEINYEYTKKEGDTIEFYQYSINYALNNVAGYDPVVYTESGSINCGMCYIFKLPDNKLIIVDSGHEQQSTQKSREGLMKFLREITDTAEGEKLEIAMWYFTHAHGDHVRLAADFIEDYHDDIIIDAVTFNFPSYQVISSGYDSNTFTLKTNLNKYFPDVTYHKLHTGEVLSLAGLTMEVVFTHEDMVNAAGKSRVSDFNSTSTVLKINFEGKTIMLLADLADDAESVFVAMHSEAYYKSDMVQIAHHGFNRLPRVYALVNAPIALFPQSMFNMKDPNNGQGNLQKYQLFMTYSSEEYFAHKYTYKFTVVNGEFVAEALPRYDAQ